MRPRRWLRSWSCFGGIWCRRRRRAGAGLSVAAGHDGGAARHRRVHRHDRADRRRGHAPGARSAGDRREHARCRRHDRPPSRGPLAGRRLHHPDRTMGHQCRERRGSQSAVRPAQGPRAAGADRQPAVHDRRQEGAAGEHAAGADRILEGQRRQGVGRHLRSRQPEPRRRRVLPERDRRQVPVRAVSQRRACRRRTSSRARST